MPKPCSQCDRQAVFNEQGHLLCVEHWQMIRETLRRDQETNLRAQELAMQQVLQAEMQFAEAAMDAGMYARALAKAEAFKRREVTSMTQNVNVSGSVVGALTTGGSIDKLSVRIGDLQKKVETSEIAKALQELKDVILQSQHLEDDAKREAADQLSYLAGQAAQPEGTREGGVIKPILMGLNTVLSVTADVIQVWDKWGPVVLAYFLRQSG